MKPIERADLALEGLSIGDAFGQMFFGKEDVMLSMIDAKALPVRALALVLNNCSAAAFAERMVPASSSVSSATGSAARRSAGLGSTTQAAASASAGSCSLSALRRARSICPA